MEFPVYFHTVCDKYLYFTVVFWQPQFLAALASELANVGKSQVARMAAGLQLKNQLTSKDPNVRAQFQQRWLGLDNTLRDHVRSLVNIYPL